MPIEKACNLRPEKRDIPPLVWAEFPSPQKPNQFVSRRDNSKVTSEFPRQFLVTVIAGLFSSPEGCGSNGPCPPVKNEYPRLFHPSLLDVMHRSSRT
jgi:hypothetical protein